MKVLVPDYYEDFSCTAGKCRHSCCLGWEIDIDENTAEYYRTLRGRIGKKLKACIRYADDGASFVLDEDERCPFLDENNLCELIIELGEDSLCQICRDHPRFRNYFSDRTELGLGLCCEAAAELILSRREKPSFVVLAEDGEAENCTEEEKVFFARRDGLLAKVSEINRTCSHADLSPEFMLSLERLDKAWEEKLKLLLGYREKIKKTAVPDELTVPFEQFVSYLIFRHLPDENGDLSFICESAGLVKDLCRAEICRKGSCTFPDFVEIAREWSSEIEYSDENIGKIVRELCLSH